MNSESPSLPQHIAIIMDGNRRWAKKNKLQILQGHQYVVDRVIEPLAIRCIELGIPYLTLWAFSTENWHRDQSEVQGLLNLFRNAFSKSADRLHQLGVKLNFIGDVSGFPEDLQNNVSKSMAASAQNDKITLTFALNYGGRNEIIRAVKKLYQQVLEQGLKPEELTENQLAAQLDTHDLPDPDLIIRPGGEQRLSGLLPWQSVYSELYFTEVLMPDFSASELDKALAEYTQRQRRFGG